MILGYHYQKLYKPMKSWSPPSSITPVTPGAAGLVAPITCARNSLHGLRKPSRSRGVPEKMEGFMRKISENLGFMWKNWWTWMKMDSHLGFSIETWWKLLDLMPFYGTNWGCLMMFDVFLASDFWGSKRGSPQNHGMIGITFCGGTPKRFPC